MSSTWSSFTKQIRKYLSDSDEQIVKILRRKFLQTTCEFQKPEVSKPILDKCIAEIAFNPDRIYVILNDLKTTFKLHTSKIDKKSQQVITKRRLDFKTISQDVGSSHIKPNNSPNHCTDDEVSHKNSSPVSSCSGDDDVIIVDSPGSPNVIKPPSNPIQSSFGCLKSSTSENKDQKKCVDSNNEDQEKECIDRNNEDFGDIQNDKRCRIIGRLECLMTRLSQAIRELEEKELDFNELDSSNSPYLKLDALKRQYLKVWRRHCELRNVARKSGRILRQRFIYNGSQYPKVNEKIEEIINQKRLFPDWTDIYRIVTSVNKEEHLNLTGSTVKSLAREIFIDVGHSLKQRRQDDLRHDFGCHLTDDLCDDDDPTYSSRDLRRKLTENKRIGDNNLNKVFKHYIDIQHTIQTVQQIIQEPEDNNKVEHDVNRQSDMMNSSGKVSIPNPVCFATNTQQCENDKLPSSPATSDEVLTLSSDSDENEETKPHDITSGSVSSSVSGYDESTATNDVSQESSVKNDRRDEKIKDNIDASNNSLSVPVTCSSTTLPTTTIDLLDDDISSTDCFTSTPREKRPRLDHSCHSTDPSITYNNRFPFSTPLLQETRQSSQVLTVATRYGPYGCDTFSQMASAHVVHRYPVTTINNNNTTTLITNKILEESSRHFVNNSIVHVNSCSSTFKPLATLCNNKSSSISHPTTTQYHLPNSNSLNNTNDVTTSCKNSPRVYDHETIEID
ncbi:unnamed protein product [Schistosoma guineensis]|nr:unnamed protein product [Schistosoma guineensis]